MSPIQSERRSRCNLQWSWHGRPRRQPCVVPTRTVMVGNPYRGGSFRSFCTRDEARRIVALCSPLVFFNSQIRLDFRCGEIDRTFKPVSARLAGPYVPNTALGPMLRPFWCNDSTTTLRTLDDWPFVHGDLSLSPTPMKGRSLKNQARSRNPDQLLLQDFSDRSATDCGEYSQAAGALAARRQTSSPSATAAKDSNTRDECNISKWTPAVRHSQLALALRRKRRKLERSGQFQLG